MFSVAFLAILAVAVWQCESQNIPGTQFGHKMEVRDFARRAGIRGESRIELTLQHQRIALNNLKQRVRFLERAMRVGGRKYGTIGDVGLCAEGDFRCKSRGGYQQNKMLSLGPLELNFPVHTPKKSSHKQHCLVSCLDECDNDSRSSYTFDGINAKELASKQKFSTMNDCKKCQIKCTHMDKETDQTGIKLNLNPWNQKSKSKRGSRYMDVPMYDIPVDYYDISSWDFNDMFSTY